MQFNVNAAKERVSSYETSLPPSLHESKHACKIISDNSPVIVLSSVYAT